jgi:uncharacterized Zn-binding protein involved in type VI secretion
MPMPIARVGDLGAHGNILASGSLNVLDLLMPVHRMLDVYVCPRHGIGITLLNCSLKVFVNGLPVAKVTSIGICRNGQPTPIITGDPKTLVDVV